MKRFFFLTSFILTGLLQVGIVFAYPRDKSFEAEGNAIMAAFEWHDQNKNGVASSNWKSTGPTEEDILAANKIDNLATKGSREEKIINAAKNGDHKNLATLIAPGVNLEARDNQDRTALMRAAEKGSCEVVKLLLDAGANIATADNFGWTAFFIAADKNHVDVVKILIARGAAADKNFNDIFVGAVFKNNIKLVQALVGENTANIRCNTIDEAYMVLSYRNTEMAKLLAQLKAQCK